MSPCDGAAEAVADCQPSRGLAEEQLLKRELGFTLLPIARPHVGSKRRRLPTPTAKYPYADWSSPGVITDAESNVNVSALQPRGMLAFAAAVA